MAAFLRKILDLFSSAGADQTERIYLAAFGKHPAWDDHIDDIGMETDRLAQIKQSLYVEGIGGNIDAGAWDELQQKGQARPFQHLFVWRLYEETCIGRVCSSRDGKGRSRYPLILCAQCPGMSLEQALEEVAPRLEALERQAAATTSAAALRTVMHSALREIRHSLSAEPSLPEPSPAAIAQLANEALVRIAASPEMGPDHRGLLSVLYQVDREMGEFRRDATMLERISRTRITEPVVPPQPLRVPACAKDPISASRLWINFLNGQVDIYTPILALLPANESWLDLIVGAPTVSQLYCVRASTQAMPLTTQIPYTLDPEFRERASRMLATARAGVGVGQAPPNSAPAGI